MSQSLLHKGGQANIHKPELLEEGKVVEDELISFREMMLMPSLHLLNIRIPVNILLLKLYNHAELSYCGISHSDYNESSYVCVVKNGTKQAA